MKTEEIILQAPAVKNQRKTNVELLRIVMMFLIIVLHFLTNSGLSETIVSGTFNYYMFWFLKPLCFMADNVFILISGYFLVKSKFKLKKLITLWLQVAFYSAICYFVFLKVGRAEFSLRILFESIAPICSKRYWFFSMYFVFYIISPLINLIINNLDKKAHKKVVFIGFLLFVLMQIFTIKSDPFALVRGKSLIWFVYLYFVGSYLRLYGFDFIGKYKALALSIGLIVLTLISKWGLDVLLDIFNTNKISADYFVSLISITVFPASVLLFIYYLNVKINNETINKIILFFSPFTFGVYLLHDNAYMREFLWSELVVPKNYPTSLKLWVLMIISVPLIYLACCGVEWIRRGIFKLIKIDKLSEKLALKLTSVSDKLLR